MAKYCPRAVETLKGHMVQLTQGARLTKPRSPRQATTEPKIPTPELTNIPLPIKTNEIHIWDKPIRKLYTNDCGRFPIRSRSGNEYIMIAYHCDSNTILHATFANRTDKHRIRAYNSIITRLTNRVHHVNVQILDNEVSVEYKRVIEEDWKVEYQLVPPNVYRRNIAKHVIRTFKAHFLVILAGVDPEFPQYMWDNLLDQTELTLNFLRQANINPRISPWEYFNGLFDYAATLLGPVVCKVIIHTTSNKRKYFYQRGPEGLQIGPGLHHYRCFQVVDRKKTPNHYRHCRFSYTTI